MLTPAESPIYEFDSFHIDSDKRLLSNGPEPIPLTPKIFDTLLYLVRHHGTVIDKDELMSAIWPDTIVEENNLNKNISVLRRVLGESPGDARYIVTVPGKGYKFVADVRVTAPMEVQEIVNKNAADYRQDRKRQEPRLVFWSLAVLLIVFAVGTFLVSWQQNPQAGSQDAQQIPVSLYWEMSDVEQLAFIRERAQQIQKLIGDKPSEFDQEAIQVIKLEIDDYVRRKDSLSQKDFEEGLRVIFGRATQYAPLVIDAYERRNVPPALGLYQAMIESEYRDCPAPPYPDGRGPVGMFQFSRRTGSQYGLTPANYCNVEMQSDAAARHMADLSSDFGGGDSVATLGLLSYQLGGQEVRNTLRQLHSHGISERSYWVILRHRNELDPPKEWVSPRIPLAGRGIAYVPRFFAAAIIGETPEVFALATPPLTSLRSKEKR